MIAWLSSFKVESFKFILIRLTNLLALGKIVLNVK